MKNRLLLVRRRVYAKGKQAALVLVVTALHGLVLYHVATRQPTLAPLPAAVSAVTAVTAVSVELALSAPTADTAMSAPAPAPAPYQETESPVLQDALAPVQAETPPPKPVEPRVVKNPPSPKPVRKTSDNAAPHKSEKAAEAISTAPSTSAASATAAAGATTPASATAAHLNNPAPQYPALALKRKWQGTVQLRVQVLASGRPGEIQIVSSSGRDLLDQAAIAAVRQWSFVAARHSGVAIESWATFPLSFKLQ